MRYVRISSQPVEMQKEFFYNALSVTVLCCPSIAAANDQPLGIIQKMYKDFLTNNSANSINSKKNRSKYFVSALVRLYAADDERACVAGIEASGQEINVAQIRKTLSIAYKRQMMAFMRRLCRELGTVVRSKVSVLNS